MGKKAKLGKARKDKFYHLAKETGYRSRSAFKLIQLNRKYQFLQDSRVLIDLCAAPGGWLQVAAKYTPVSSLIIGVDLVPIKPIPKVVTLQQDITTVRCKQLIQKELQGWKANCVLNDGAPNVGKAWVQDAFSQAELSLHALKLACHFLSKGGWFITKVFRSRDYQPLLVVMQQLFHKVHATKPQASRNESAEIFVVCKGYLAPEKVNPSLLDPNYVFRDTEEPSEQKINLVKLQKRPKAEGYPDEAMTLYKAVGVYEFITSDKHLTLLAECSKLEFDKYSDVFARHPLTTEEIHTLCDDVKVLGPTELRQLVRWRDKMRKFLDEAGSSNDEEEQGHRGEEKTNKLLDTAEDQSLVNIEAKIERLRDLEAAEEKRELRYLRKQRRKVQKRLTKDGDAHKEAGEITRQEHLFALKNIKSRVQLSRVEEQAEQVNDEVEEEEDEEEESSDSGDEIESAESSVEDEGETEREAQREVEAEEGDSDESEDDEIMEHSLDNSSDEPNPLVVPLESNEVSKARRTQLWFSQDGVQGILGSVNQKEGEMRGEEEELQRAVAAFKQKGGQLWEREHVQEKKTDALKRKDEAISSSSSESEDSEDEEEEEEEDSLKSKRTKLDNTDDIEVVPGDTKSSLPKLDLEGLAIASLLVQSKKKREELIESGYNRWAHNDEGLPDWFLNDEAKHYQKQIPISKEMVAEYKAQLREINARPIKKIAEAKARKKQKALRRLAKAKKRAEGIIDTEDMTEQEKLRNIKQIYKKAGVLGKKKVEVKYVVAKRGLAGKRAVRPAGVKGPYRQVDPRMKKDNRSAKLKAKTNAAGKQKKVGKRKKR